MTIGRRRHLGGAVAWSLSLGALVVAAGVTAVVLREHPDHFLVAISSLAFVASTAGVVLNWRVARARLHALRDPLTGLPNRALLEDRIEQAFRRSRRSGEAFALVIVDLDGFKDVNDMRGHGAGDAVLRALARRFESMLRGSDTVARVGGDEFVVLSPTVRDDDQAAALVGRLRHALRRPFRVDGAAIEIDGSIGWAIAPGDGATAAELLAHADGRMYATKRDTVDDTFVLRRGVDAGIVSDLEAAVAHGELVVVYQPILDLRTGAPLAAEALVRRLLPDEGLLLPSEFVPHVERTPLVRDLTFVVVADALRASGRWREAGHDLGVSVNVPYRLLDDRKFADGLVELLRTYGAPSGALTLEVVPSGHGAGAELDSEAIARLCEIGVRLSLDDGGRAASFAALRVLPLDELKIDAGFVHGVTKSARDAALVRGMIQIGHALDLLVVAEGVETREVWHTLAEWGCDLGQGYYVARPQPADELLAWLGESWPAVA